MPPFRAGLLKRKIEGNEGNKGSIVTEVTENEDSSDDEKDLIKGDLDHGEDATDSEHEPEADSDEEQDKVLFEDSGDSVLGDEDQGTSDDASSDQTDSEPEESNEDSSENTDSSEDESPDSGAESAGNVSSGKSKDSSENSKAKDRKNAAFKKLSKIGTKTIEDSVNVLANKISEASVTSGPVQQKDEYESGDTSDEEDRVNTAGDIPMWWYNEYPHVGYDLDGRRIAKPPQRDQIDEFLKKCEDPEFWRTVKDPGTGQDVILSKEDLQLIQKIKNGHIPSKTHDEYEPWVEWFSREVLATPLRAFPEHKRSFLPSRSEQLHVARIVHALKMGWTKTRRQIALERRGKREKKFYDLWGSSVEEKGRAGPRHISAPRRALPAHAESYNPPPEYLLDKKEMKEWDKLKETPWKRKYTFLPERHGSLREVPAYSRFVRERFLRCLDLYLAPRAIKMRLTINAEDLVPQLPSPRDLQPFPSFEAQCLRGHTGLVRTADFDPSGQYIVSGGDDCTVRIWETSSGRCLRTVPLEGSVTRVAWTPVAGLSLVAAAVGSTLLLLNPGANIGAHRVADLTDTLLQEPPPSHDVVMDERTRSCVTWAAVDAAQWARGVRIAVTHFKPVAHLSWHARGDYLAVTLRDAAARAVIVHQVSRRRSQLPFRTAKGLVQCAVFHPHKPQMFVATQRAVRVYDLVRQELVRKLLTGAQWVSCVAAHPRGDNLLVGAYDRKVAWFDLELSAKPYQTLRLHSGAVRSVAYSPRYPLFASAGDDQNIVVSHGMVYNDLLQNPLLVPLKQLRGGDKREELCVLELHFHPTQPWLMAACADGTIRLYA